MSRILLIAGAITLLFTSGATAADYSLKLHHFLSPKSRAHTEMLVPWAERIEAVTNGRVEIEVFPSMTLGGKPPDLIKQARDGVVDIVWTVNGYTAGLYPRTEVFELPFVHTNDAIATNLAMKELFDSHLAVEHQDVKVMFLHVHAGQGFHMADTAVRTPADLEGKKMRIPSRTGAWILEALGASPVSIPVPGLPQALSKKVVDGALIPWEIIPPLKLQELTEYQIEGPGNLRFGNATFQVAMNKNTWNSLPPDIQQIIMEESDEQWLRQVGRSWTDGEELGIGVAKQAGNTLIQLTEAETAQFREKLEPVVDRWVEEVSAKGIDGRALVEAARAAIAKYTN